MKYVQVTNNMIDVHFGQYGWNPKEHVRVLRTKQGWKVNYPRPYTYPEETQVLRKLEDVLPQIIEELTNGTAKYSIFPRKSTSTK